MLLGVVHNAAYLERVLAHPAFARGELHTHFLEQHHPDLLPPPPAGAELAALLAGATLVDKGAGGEIPELYAAIGEWRN